MLLCAGEFLWWVNIIFGQHEQINGLVQKRQNSIADGLKSSHWPLEDLNVASNK